MPTDNAVFGDRSRASLGLISCDSLAELCHSSKGLPVFKNGEQKYGEGSHLWTASANSPENQSRCEGILRFFEAWEAGKQSTQQGPIVESRISALLSDSAKCFNKAWGEGSTSNPQLSFSGFSDTSPSFTTAFANWIAKQAQTNLTRGHQIVLDLALNRIFSEKFEQDGKREVGNPNDPANSSKAQIRVMFEPRVDSLRWFREWAEHEDSKSKPDYCRRENSRSVCTPILLSAGKHGVVMWLTVDLFYDGLGSLAPDIFSLGWSQIAMSPSSAQTDSDNLAQDESVGILHYFDRMWKLSRLGELGFSGRWRITNRPTTSCDASLLEAKDLQYIHSYEGRSAECAMLVCLLAASGFVYEPVPKEKVGVPSRLPERIPLSTVFAATGTVSANGDLADIRTAILGKVFDVDRKCGACAGYKLQPSVDTEAPFIDSIVISQADYDQQKKDSGSQVSQAEDRATLEKSNPTKIAVRGVHFQPCKTVQDALNWMLSVNQWKRVWNQAKLEAWEKQWDVVRNEFGQPIGREVDENGNHILVDEVQGVSTGSIEYMRNPFGGAKKPETVPADEDDSSGDDEPEVKPNEG